MSARLECPICLNSLLEPCGMDGELGENPVPSSSTSTSSSPRGRVATPGPRAGPGPSSRIQKSVGRPPQVNLRVTADNSSTEISATPCGHLFHSMCLQNWMREKIGPPSCPNCRKVVKKRKIHKIFLDVEPPVSGSGNSPSFAGKGGFGDPSLVDDNYGSDSDVECVDSEEGNGRSSTRFDSSNRKRDITDLNPIAYNGTNLQKLKFLHDTLISDFNELKTKYYDLKDEVGLRDATILSLEQEQQRLKTELQKYTEGGSSHNKRKAPIAKETGTAGKRKRT